VIGSELPAVFSGLASATSFGAGDFYGGIATKRSSVYSVIILADIVGLVLMLGMAFALNESVPSTADMLWGSLAGILGTIGAVALYRGLAFGTMSVVAPVTGVVSAVIPVLFGLFTEGLVSTPQLVGFCFAFVAIWFITRTGEGVRVDINDLKLPFLAGLGFGLFYIFIGNVSETTFFWPLVAARASSIGSLLLVALLVQQLEMPSRRQLPLILSIGIFNSGGIVFFTLATRLGRLDVAAILTSLHPTVTVLLAWLVLKEKLTALQWVGVIAALVAVVLIAY
jgi:drug/metabolite transporter (DMT)-like permease